MNPDGNGAVRRIFQEVADMKKRSLGFKLTMGGVIVVLVPLLIVGAFAAFKSSSALTDAAKEQVARIAKDVADMVQLVLQEEVKLVSSLAANDAVVAAAAKVAAGGAEGASGEIEKMTSELEAVMKNIGRDYETLIAIDAKGVIFGDGVGGKYKGVSIAERDYFKTARGGKPNVGSVVKSKVTNNPIIPIASPIYSKSGEVIGAIATIMKIDFLSEKINAIKIGKTGYPWIIDKTGMTVVHPRKEFILELNLSTQEGMKEYVAKMIAGKEGVDDYVFKGVHKTSAFATIDINGWKVGATQDSDDFLASAHMIRNFIALMGLIFITLTVLAVVFFSRSISKPINTIVSELTDAARQIATASTEVSSASQSLAEGASEQAAAIEETSSSLEEMSSMTRRNADNAVQANSMMTEVKQVVTRANESMRSLTKSMDDITRSSEETSKIIKTIDEIAFQTNLLALNAAVEAARAGEAGAGFAVVAEEVRNLAIRAAEAAKNTSTLIEGSVKKIKEGTELVNKTNKDFAEVADSSTKVAELIGEISAASTEQAEGIGQVNKAVVEMDKVVQHNAANAEELASAAEESNAQAETMKGHIVGLRTIVSGGDGQSDHSSPTMISHARKDIPGAKEGKKAIPFLRKGGEAKGKSSGKDRQLKPEEIIPLDDKDFRDF